MSVTQLPFFQHVRWQPDRKELGRFALSMFCGFAVLGLIVAWRESSFGHRTLVLWSIGVSLATSALLPTLGRYSYLAIYLPTSFIGYFISKVILCLMFFLVFWPLATILRFLGKDILSLNPQGVRAIWNPVSRSNDPNRYYRQF
jgi:hypothetical protein